MLDINVWVRFGFHSSFVDDKCEFSKIHNLVVYGLDCMNILLIANTANDILLRKKLLIRLNEAGHTLFLASSIKPQDRQTLQELQIQATTVDISPRSTNPMKDAFLYFTYKKIFTIFSPNLILSYHIKPNIYGAMAAKKANIPIISNITGLGKVFDHDSILQTLVVFLYKRAFKNNKKAFVFFQNNDDKTLFLQKGIIKDTQSCDVLPGSGVDIEFFKPNFEPIKEADIHSEYKNKKLQFSYVGRLVISKGIRLFIEAAKRISKERSDCIFNIAGSYIENDRDFIQRDELEEACTSDAIKYYGQVNDVRAFLKEHTDCLIFPSHYREGIPRCLLEAAAMAKPLIASNSAGTKEPCKDGINGYLVKKNDVDDLVEKIKQFIDMSEEAKRAMGKASRQIAEKDFSDEIVVSKYLSKISEL